MGLRGVVRGEKGECGVRECSPGVELLKGHWNLVFVAL